MSALRAAGVARPAVALSLRGTSVAQRPFGTAGAMRMAAAKSFHKDEPAAPILKTKIPGPRAAEAVKALDEVFETRSINMMADYTQSVGNYISDPDGNMLLDV
ncbi:4-aminobutyrate transaminase, partial [Conoideocrella luteorostrata]